MGTAAFRALLAFALLAASLPASAVYRCEQNGVTSYSDSPCPGGRRLPPPAAVSSDEAERRAAAEKQRLAEIEDAAARREAESRRHRQRQARVDAAVQRRCDKLASRAAWAAESESKASIRSAANARRKAERAAEQYDSECSELKRRNENLIGSVG